MSCPNCGNTQLEYQQDNYNTNPQYNNYNNQQYVSNMNNNQQVRKNGFNSLAIGSFVLCLLAFFWQWWLSIASIGLALASFVQISKTKEHGLMISVLSLLLNILMFVVMFSYYGYI